MNDSDIIDVVGPRSGVAAWEWQDAAACADADTEIFFNESARHGWRPICESCPVAGICFWSAMVAEGDCPVSHRFGIYGGAMPVLRARIAGQLDRAGIEERLAEAVAGWVEDPGGAAGIPEVVRVADDARLAESLARRQAQAQARGVGEVPTPGCYSGKPDKLGRRFLRKNPAPGMRRCSGPCDQVLPIGAFDLNDRVRGYRDSLCRDCKRDYNRERERARRARERAERQRTVAA